ncbi:MAG: amidohydrolase family protein [Clostridia bacterium]|nr:amidohydrolase family protein [Clostridia bacterium]
MYSKNIKNCEQFTEQYDLVIVGGNVIDVNDNTIKKRNIGICQNKIEIVTSKYISGHKTIDATGLMVAPGFIDFNSHVDGNLYSAQCLVRQGGTTTLGGLRHINGRVIRKIEEEGFVVNQGFFISHSFTLRSAAGIVDRYKPAARSEIKFMKDLAERFLEHGAYGIYFGLEFVPGTSIDEMLALAKVAKEHDKVISVHIRKDGPEGLQYFDEVIQTAELTGVKVQMIQLVYNIGIGGAMEKGLGIIEEARQRGLDITGDSGVYDAFTACIGTSIFDPGWEKEYGKYGVNDLLISSGIYMGQYCTKDLFHYLRQEFPSTLVTAFVCDSDAIISAMKKSYIFISTNAADGPHYPGMGAPEVSGTYPKLIGQYVRQKKAIGLIEAIKKITLLPAERFGLVNKGAIEEGMDADIAIFDYDHIIDCATFMGQGEPDAPPKGIHYVLVNGQIVVKDGALTQNLFAGKLLRKY